MSPPGEAPMSGPLCLIENRPDGGLVLREEARAVLQRVRQPVVVVAVVGLYRTGKSYLMNRLAGQRKGFSLGSTVEGNTKGIWMWCRPHPLRSDRTLVLLDTEGLGDVGKGNTQNDAWLFALAILLSSTLVYNSVGTIDQNALEQLHYVSELTQKIRVTSSRDRSREDEDSSEFVRYFPAFIWAVRDFTLQLEINGRPVSEDDYLENALRLQKGDTEQVRRCNLPRSCIRTFFPSRKCFTFDRPTSRKNLRRLEELEEEDLEEEFLEPVARFCDHVWETSKRKTLPRGQAVTGAMLANLAEAYVGAINSGEVPCLENAFVALAEMENAVAVREALSHYDKEMQRRVVLPTRSVEELQWTHAECEWEATGVFIAHAFGDNIKKFQDELTDQLQGRLGELCRQNEGASLDRCQAVLTELYQEVEDKVVRGHYLQLGGYQRFLSDRQSMEERFYQAEDKGLMAAQALQDFLASKEEVGQSIRQVEQALLEKEKQLEAEKVRAEAAQREAQLQREMLERAERSLEEHKKQRVAKAQQERRAMLAEGERLLQQRLQEQRRRQEEGFRREERRRLEEEIQGLKDQIQEQRSGGKCTVS